MAGQVFTGSIVCMMQMMHRTRSALAWIHVDLPLHVCCCMLATTPREAQKKDAMVGV